MAIRENGKTGFSIFGIFSPVLTIFWQNSFKCTVRCAVLRHCFKATCGVEMVML